MMNINPMMLLNANFADSMPPGMVGGSTKRFTTRPRWKKKQIARRRKYIAKMSQQRNRA